MPLFRAHRGGLQDSLDTTRIVKNISELKLAILRDWDNWPTINQDIHIEVEPYPSFGSCFDRRIGWYTQLVTANVIEKDKMHPVGFLSEPLD